MTGVEEITQDALQGGRIAFLQPKSGYRAAVDPVLLAAALPLKGGETVLDAGSGAGAASLCLAARVPDCRITGLELQPSLAALFSRNIMLNGLEGRIRAVTGDLGALPDELAGAAFDAVMTNPPFARESEGTRPPDPSKAAAHVEDGLSLADWIAACARRVKPKGWFAIVHRADRLPALLAAMEGKFGGVTTIPLWPGAKIPAKRVIVIGRKGAKAGAVLSPGLVLHRNDGTFTPEADRILRKGDALPAAGKSL